MQRFGASKTEATPFPCMQVRLSWRMTCRVPFPLLETSPLYEYEDLKGGNIPTVTRIEQVRVEGSCASRARANHDSDPIFGALVEAPPKRRRSSLTESNPETFEARRWRAAALDW